MAMQKALDLIRKSQENIMQQTAKQTYKEISLDTYAAKKHEIS
jgi:hypothetical protein